MISVDCYVIMPNHVHMILFIDRSTEQGVSAPTLSHVVQQMKGHVTKCIGKAVWQSRFYDHVIRNVQDYREIWTYIENNPAKWLEDRYYVPDRDMMIL